MVQGTALRQVTPAKLTFTYNATNHLIDDLLPISTPSFQSKQLDIKLVFSSFKIGKLFSMKDPILGGLCLRVVYKFACAGCKACYVIETTLFQTRAHLVSDKASHIFKHLQNSEHCCALCSGDPGQ